MKNSCKVFTPKILTNKSYFHPLFCCWYHGHKKTSLMSNTNLAVQCS
jgi:hypothetical protein